MADPITAPVGSHFLLTWSTDAYVEMVNTFQLIDGTTKDIPGRKPKKGIAKGKVKALLTITKDGKPDGFRVDLPDPGDAERLSPKMTFFHEYTFIFRARVPATYVFTVTFTAEPDQAKAPPPITKEVVVVKADKVNDRRQDMLDLIDKWFPSSVMGAQTIPPGESKDILGRSGWDQTTPKSWTIPARYPAGPIETLPKSGKGVWVQAGAGVTALGEGQISAAKGSFNKHVLPARQAAFDALPAADKAGHARPASIPIVTSCLSVMGELVTLWGKQFTADLNTMVNADPAFYIKASEEFAKPSPSQPKPGDILYLGKEHNRGEFQHVCVLVSRSSELWVTADGGGGALPDQTATVSDKRISWTTAKKALPGQPASPAVPMFVSVTDGKTKALHGWVDIDLVPNDKYNADGSRK